MVLHIFSVKPAKEQDLSYWPEWRCVRAGLKEDRSLFQEQWKTPNRVCFQNWQFHLEKEGKITVHHRNTLCEVLNDVKGRKVRAEQAFYRNLNKIIKKVRVLYKTT